MNLRLRLSVALVLVGFAWGISASSRSPVQADDPKAVDSMDVLLITSGCCHDYDFQTKSLQLAAKSHGLSVNWTVVSEGGTGTSAKIDFYDDENWADGFDLVIHNECFAKTDDPQYIRRITEPHFAGVDSIVIHCAMHTYRDTTIDDWRKFLGVTSRRHEHKSHYPVTVIDGDHPIVAHVPGDYVTPIDELYVIERTWPNTTVLATSESEKTGESHPVFWLNRFGEADVFGTTYGHSNETFQDEVFLRTLTNAMRFLVHGGANEG